MDKRMAKDGSPDEPEMDEDLAAAIADTEANADFVDDPLNRGITSFVEVQNRSDVVTFLTGKIQLVRAMDTSTSLIMTTFANQFAATTLFSDVPLLAHSPLLNWLVDSIPPTWAMLLTLPSISAIIATAHGRFWAVYCVFMEKLGCRPRLYFGSTVNLVGLYVRNSDDVKVRRARLPFGVMKALDEGFTIIHVGAVFIAPVPESKDVPEVRGFFLELEAAATYIFWAVNITATQWPSGMDVICPWDPTELEWDGLCTHSAVREGRHVKLELTAEELEQQEELRLARERAYPVDPVKRAASNKRHKENIKNDPVRLAKQHAYRRDRYARPEVKAKRDAAEAALTPDEREARNKRQNGNKITRKRAKLLELEKGQSTLSSTSQARPISDQ